MVPWDYDFNEDNYDGLFISNGPGDPLMCDKTIAHLRKALEGEKPIFGICLGNQLLALAAGAKVGAWGKGRGGEEAEGKGVGERSRGRRGERSRGKE